MQPGLLIRDQRLYGPPKRSAFDDAGWAGTGRVDVPDTVAPQIASLSRMWSPSHELVDWAQVISVGLSLVALVVALYALVKGRRDLLQERRVTHELEVLRHIAGALRSSFGSSSLLHLMRTYLRLLPGNQDFPIARAEFKIRPSERGTQLLAALKAKTGTSPIEQYLATPEFLQTCEEELDEAIERRIQKGRFLKG